MGTFDQVRQQVGPPPATIRGNFVNSATKADMVRRRLPFWVINIDPQPRVNSRFTNSNGQAKLEWVYHIVPLQGGEEMILTLAANWQRDQESPRLIEILRQSGQPLGPAILIYEVPPGGNRAMHTIADWDQSQPAVSTPLVQAPKAAIAAAMSAPATINPWAQSPPSPMPPIIPWQPLPGVGIPPPQQATQAPPAAQVVQPPPVAPIAPPAPSGSAPSGSPPAPTLEGGRPVGAGPDGMAPLQFACGCLATRSTRQVYQPCAIHAPTTAQPVAVGQPVGVSTPMAVPPIAALTSGIHQATGAEAQALCNRCNQMISGEVTQIGAARYITHSNCPNAASPQETALLRVV